MIIDLVPADSVDTASSRIRVYTLERALRSLGHDVHIGVRSHADVLFIQKRVTDETLQRAVRAKAAGCTILYDVDDLGPALSYFVSDRAFYEMIRLADGVTTDTEGHRVQLRRRYRVARAEIVPDAVDFFPSEPTPPVASENGRLRVLWFGNSANFLLFERYARALAAVPGVEVLAMTSEASLAEYSRRAPQVTFVPWSRDAFLPLLQSCHLTCLMHDGTEIDRAKSNNKMITSIAWGVPALVSNTPEYERTAHLAGVESAVFANEGELCTAVERLRSRDARLAYLSRSQSEIWRRFGPHAVAAEFLAVAERHRSASSTAVRPARVRRTLGFRRQAEFAIWKFRVAEDRAALATSVFRATISRMRSFIQKPSHAR